MAVHPDWDHGCNVQLREAAAGYARACVNGAREAHGLGDVNISFLVGSVFDQALLEGAALVSLSSIIQALLLLSRLQEGKKQSICSTRLMQSQ